MTSNHHWDIFTYCVIKLHLEILREAQGKFPRGNITRDSTGGGNIHIENSHSFPLNFRWKVMRKFPQG